jgi:hypothetical protein
MFAWGWDEFGLDADDDDGWEEGKEGNGGSFARVDERALDPAMRGMSWMTGGWTIEKLRIRIHCKDKLLMSVNTIDEYIDDESRFLYITRKHKKL